MAFWQHEKIGSVQTNFFQLPLHEIPQGAIAWQTFITIGIDVFSVGTKGVSRMSEKRQYEKPALVNCGTMVEQTGCWDGTDNAISNGYLGGQQPPTGGFSNHHGRGRR
jgi:hypothetical protein